MVFGIKKEIDTAAAKDFWSWFVQNENWIIENIKTNGHEVVARIDKKITPVFPYFRKDIEFQLGFNEGTGEFFFFDLKNKQLKRDGETLKNMMPDSLSRWSFIIEH